MLNKRFMQTLGSILGLIALPAIALAADAPKLDTGNTAWMLTSTALVLLMTIPGLALFYGGMVRSKNVLATLMQCFAITCVVTILWALFGYSIAFGDGGSANAIWGGLGKAFLKGVGVDSLSGSIPETVFMVFQMTFAIITPALIIGAFAERMKFSAMLWFMSIWLLVVYSPIAHWVWGGGWLGAKGVQDFAGGTVVHINAGVAGLVAITPASGFVGPMGSIAIGAIAGVGCFLAATKMKKAFGYDDSLDAFGVHAIGGIIGALLTGIFSAASMGGSGLSDAAHGSISAQFGIQVVGVLGTLIYTAVATLIILKIIDVVIGLRVTEEQEEEGLDIALHDERGYNL
ncbi:MAG: ammonium transporter [Gammaproteobacteria bacterium]